MQQPDHTEEEPRPTSPAEGVSAKGGILHRVRGVAGSVRKALFGPPIASDNAGRRRFLGTSAKVAAGIVIGGGSILPNAGCNGPIEAVKEAVGTVVDFFDHALTSTGEELSNIGRELDLVRRKFPLIGNQPPISASRVRDSLNNQSNPDEKLLAYAYAAVKNKVAAAIPSTGQLPPGRNRDILIDYFTLVYTTDKVADMYSTQRSKREAISSAQDLKADNAVTKTKPQYEELDEEIEGIQEKLEELGNKPSSAYTSARMRHLNKRLEDLNKQRNSVVTGYNTDVNGDDPKYEEALRREMHMAKVLSGLNHGLAIAKDRLKDAMAEERRNNRD